MDETNWTILVVDDDPYLRLIASMELPTVAVLEASTASEAFEVASAGRPDAVLVDRRLPDGDGLDLVRRLRNAEATATLPILVITAGHDEADRLDVIGAGADEYLAKPFEPADLLARLERIIGVTPDARRRRRLSLMQRLREGVRTDPDPLPRPEPEPPAPARRRFGLFSRRESGGP